MGVLWVPQYCACVLHIQVFCCLIQCSTCHWVGNEYPWTTKITVVISAAVNYSAIFVQIQTQIKKFCIFYKVCRQIYYCSFWIEWGMINPQVIFCQCIGGVREIFHHFMSSRRNRKLEKISKVRRIPLLDICHRRLFFSLPRYLLPCSYPGHLSP